MVARVAAKQSLTHSGIVKNGEDEMAKAMHMLDSRKMGAAAQSLRDELRAAVIGQDEAIDEIVNLYQAWSAGMIAGNRPAGKFLFLGPTGTGKTRVVEATVGCLIKDPNALIKIDCGEFQHSHEIAKLIGSPPGYLGHRETSPLLSQERLNAQHTDKLKLSFVLFDEIEKASDALWNLLLGILDKATLTTGSNMRVDFSHTMIFMTSNVGAAEMNAILNPQTGFKVVEENRVDTPKRITASALGAARRKFPPEFVNRADRIVVFQPLGRDELRRVLDIELNMVQQRIIDTAGPRCLRLQGKRRRKGLAAGARYGYQVWCAAAQAGHRQAAGVSAVQPDGDRADRGQRCNPGGCRRRAPGICPN
jgi:ATP-dependent Clp protease ATP-binding subunit ClpB